MKKIFIFGDSNTYGYDPDEHSSGRYPRSVRWTGILQDRLKDTFKIVDDGMNGRPLPAPFGSHLHLKRQIEQEKPLDLFVCMLGTNDILLTTQPDASVPIERMDRFLYWLREEKVGRILVIAPVYIGDGQDRLYERYHEQSMIMNSSFEKLSEKHGVYFADAAKWGIALAPDQVHFSPEGSRAFAEHMEKLLTELL